MDRKQGTMAVHSYSDLRQHIGHNLEVIAKGDPDCPENVAIECITCNEVLLDYNAPEEVSEPYVVHGPNGLWTGNGWGTPEQAKQYENPDYAQDQADALHHACLGFNSQKSREEAANSAFVVRGFQSGERYKPKPLVKNRYVFVREGFKGRHKR